MQENNDPSNGQWLPSPNDPDHQQPAQRRPDRRLDAVNPYATPQQQPPYGQLPPSPYTQTQSANVPYAGQPPANPYAAQQPPPAYEPGYQQPNYQQPSGYGQPTGPSPNSAKGSRGKLWLVLVAVLVIGGGSAAAAFVVKPSFLGFKKVFDHAALEKTIEQQSDGQLSNVSCPAGEQVKAGARFQCSAADGKKVDVFVRDSSGNYVWILDH